ncbi:MAG: CHASE3 domain-containing protein [Rhodospirillales bacterium]
MTRYIVKRANVLVFGVLIAMVFAVGVMTWDRFVNARAARQWSEHTFEVLGAIDALQVGIRDAETGQRGYLLTGNNDYLAPYTAALERVTFLEGELQRLTADNPAQQARLRALGPLMQRKLEELAQAAQLRRDDGIEAAMRVVRTDVGRVLMTQLEGTLGAMTAEENRLLAQRLQEVNRRGVWVLRFIMAMTACAIGALIWAAWMLNQAWYRATRLEAQQRSLATRLRTSLESLSQGVAVFSADRRLTNWNECFQILLDLPKTLMRTNTPYDTFVRHLTEDGVSFLESEAQIQHGGFAPGMAHTYERTRANGLLLEVRRTPMPDHGFVLTVSDMTKRAQAEGVLRESQKMQAIGQLTGGIAHDFNNLLTVILGNLEYVRAKVEGNQVLQTRIERATWAAQRGATLTHQLLAFARRQALAPAPIDLAATMPDLIPLLRRTLGEHIEVRYVETASLWPAMADAAQLESAVLNLALNARDAMPNGGRLTIELANRVLDEEYAEKHAEVVPGDYTMLAVSDTGHGMTQDVVARVFEPFFTTKQDGKGTGLGLPMVFGFVKQSGGHIKIYSEPGEGTTVRIYLPRAIGATAQGAKRTAPPVELPRGTSVELPRGTSTVLVVEDEPAVREIAVTILTDLGYRVLEAADGAEGLRVFEANAAEIDLVLTDVVLPGGVKGREMADRIKAMRPEVRLLFMSGYTENSIVHHGRLDDGVQLIGKPFTREQLARKVAETLGPRAAASGDGGSVVELKPRRSV